MLRGWAACVVLYPAACEPSTPADGLHICEVHPHKLPPVLCIQAAEGPAGSVTAQQDSSITCMLSIRKLQFSWSAGPI